MREKTTTTKNNNWWHFPRFFLFVGRSFNWHKHSDSLTSKTGQLLCNYKWFLYNWQTLYSVFHPFETVWRLGDITLSMVGATIRLTRKLSILIIFWLYISRLLDYFDYVCWGFQGLLASYIQVTPYKFKRLANLAKIQFFAFGVFDSILHLRMSKHKWIHRTEKDSGNLCQITSNVFPDHYD